MSTFTIEQLRERAREKVKSLEFAVTQTAFADLRAELEGELELARIALASLEAEPVAWMVKDTDTGEKIIRSDRSCFEGSCQPLYTAQPAAVVHEGYSSVIAEQLAHVLSGMEVTDHQRAIISCAVDRLNHNAEILQKAPTAQEATLYEPSPTDSVNAPLKFTDVEDRAWVVGAEWMRDAFKRENPHLRIANDNDPAPVFVPDERYQHLSELYHAQENRLFKLAQRIKGPSFDKYAHSPSQAIDVLESAIFGEREEDCRAAMLQGAEPVTTAYKLPEPIKDHRLNSGPDSDDYYAGYQAGWNELLESVSGDSPVIPDGWVACSEQMPKFGDYLVTDGQDFDVQMFNGEQFIPGFVWEDNITHWMPLPAAPQQEA